jgi:integrase
MSDIAPAYITTIFEKMRRGHERSVILKCWTLLNAILEDAVDDDVISKNPLRKVGRPKTKLPEKPVIEADLIVRVLEEVQDNAFASAVLHVGTFCAMRTAEVFGLRWSALQGDQFVIRDSAWEGKLLKDSTKTGQRSVFIPPATLAAITRWRADATFTSQNDILFATTTGTPMSAHNFSNRVLVPVRDKLKLPALTFQILRRSHATRNQATPKDAQAHLGHKNITTTLGIYTQSIPASVKAMVARDEAVILSASEVIAPELHPSGKAENWLSS